MVQTVVRSTLSLTFVLAAARVVFNIKGRVTREAAWKLELSGDLTKQRRVEAVDKLLSVLFLLVTSVLGLQAVGLDVNSVLAIGGVGGLAVGLAGREILENLFTGLIILSSSPFEVGDEVQFTPPSGGVVEGIVIDVGWYRTTIRSFEREVFNIPNSVFSRNVVLNVTRKAREWRFYERLYLRVEDAVRCPGVVADMRKVLRADPRIIQKLHRRVFLERVDRDQATVYVSFYVEAANRDQFMAIKQDLLLAFLDCVEQNGAALARNRLVVAVEAAGGTTGLPLAAALALPAARGGLGFTASPSMGGGGGGGGGGGRQGRRRWWWQRDHFDALFCCFSSDDRRGDADDDDDNDDNNDSGAFRRSPCCCPGRRRCLDLGGGSGCRRRVQRRPQGDGGDDDERSLEARRRCRRRRKGTCSSSSNNSRCCCCCSGNSSSSNNHGSKGRGVPRPPGRRRDEDL